MVAFETGTSLDGQTFNAQLSTFNIEVNVRLALKVES
jgi:hypothetical protein